MNLKPFQHVKNRNPGRSVFDLSYDKKFNCDMGQLIPIMCDEANPNERWTLANEMVIRMQPMVAPILHAVNATVHYFFVPYRLLWSEWEEFITGGVDGPQEPDTGPVLPRWNPTITAKYSLWDYLGFPTDIVPNGRLPIDFPRSAYNFIWNEYYRDQTHQDEVLLTNENILYRAWEKDYFTSALPWQQRGIAPALPVSGVTSAQWTGASFASTGAPTTDSGFTNTALDPVWRHASAERSQNARDFMNNNTVDMSNLTTFDVADLRLAFSVQRWMERNARSGARYTEFLKAHFNSAPRDERLDRPEFIGATKSPIIVSEVLQTSGTPNDPDTGYTSEPLGTLGGHGLMADRNMAGTYNVQEYGLIMGILSIKPKTAYQQGINRQWLRQTRYDFFFPEFQNLSEQAVEQVEVYATAVPSENATLFGYQGRYDELRYKPSMVCADFRDVFSYWHLGRIFTSPPALNSDFIECKPSKRIFAVQDEPGFMVNCMNMVKAIRPLPVIAEPGLIDH